MRIPILSTARGLRRAAAAAAALVLTAGLVSCAESQRGNEGGNEQNTATFVFGASSDPVMLDPSHASDGETFRVTRQIFEGLVGLKSGTTELEPALATEWEAGEDGKTFNFTLREGVKFHDGTEFNAEAVCYNFDRWYNWTGLNQNENIAPYYIDVLGGFKTGPTAKNAVYDSCSADDPTHVTIKLQKPFAAFIQAMTLPSFSMQSPTAMKEHNADDIAGTEDDPRFSSYATAHPTGTGPFKFSKWERGQSVTLTKNEDYWGDQAKVDSVIIRTISDPSARTQELQAGGIDGYDLVAPADIQPLKDKGFQVLNRPAFNILYMGMNQYNKDLQDLKVRQAISYAVDKEAVVKQSLPEGSKTATQFIPDMVNGYADDPTVYEHDPEKAKALLKEAGFTEDKPLTLKFAYPTGVSRPYMPTPEDTFLALKAQLEAAGIKIEPVSAKWTPEYLDMTGSEDGQSKYDVYLLGWTGDYNDTYNFIGVFFGGQSMEWGFDNPELFQMINDARVLPDIEEQTAAYEEANAALLEFLPGLPIAHPVPSLAFREGVVYPASPVQDEVYNMVELPD